MGSDITRECGFSESTATPERDRERRWRERSDITLAESMSVSAIVAFKRADFYPNGNWSEVHASNFVLRFHGVIYSHY